MKSSTKMPRPQLMKALAEQLKKRTDEYILKKQRFDDELAHDLEQLYSAYGTDIVKMVIASGGVASRKPRSTADESSSSSTKSDGQKKDRGMGMKELKPHISEAIEKLKGKQFTRKDVDEILATKGIQFDYSYVSFILRNSPEIESVGKKKQTSGMGPPLNVYRVKTDASAEQTTQTHASHVQAKAS